MRASVTIEGKDYLMDNIMEGTFCIPPEKSRDPEYWAWAEFGTSIFLRADLETQKEMRSIMATVALLHNKFPERESFDVGEVAQYQGEIYDRFPHLKPLREMPEAC